jgi:hypothetical protein
VRRLLRGLDAIERSGLRDWTLIGGLAVMARLSGAHRPTGDLDTVACDSDPDARLILLTLDGAEATATGVRLPDGSKIDALDVGSALEVESLPDDEKQRMFALSHWWMADSAELVRLRLIRRDGEATSIAFERELRLARSPGLAAAKLQSIPTRRGETADKRHSDAYDVYRLLGCQLGQAVARGMAEGPLDLPTWCAGFLEELFVASSVRTARWMAEVAGPVDAPSAAEVEVAGSLAAEALRSALEDRAHETAAEG